MYTESPCVSLDDQMVSLLSPSTQNNFSTFAILG